MKQDEKHRIEELKTQMYEQKKNNLEKIDELNREAQAKVDEVNKQWLEKLDESTT